MKINVADFTEYPGPRYCVQGKNSGEEFYHKILNEAFASALERKQHLIVNLDGTAGYPSSFLDEAFGNLVFDYTLEKVKSNIEIISTQEPDWQIMITDEVFKDWEKKRTSNEKSKKTIKHDPWYKLKNGSLLKKAWT